MPSKFSTAEAIKTRLRQTDAHYVKSIKYLAQVWRAVRPQHPEYAYDLFRLMISTEMLRQALLAVYNRHDGYDPRRMWSPKQLPAILEESIPVPKTVRGS